MYRFISGPKKDVVNTLNALDKTYNVDVKAMISDFRPGLSTASESGEVCVLVRLTADK